MRFRSKVNFLSGRVSLTNQHQTWANVVLPESSLRNSFHKLNNWCSFHKSMFSHSSDYISLVIYFMYMLHFGYIFKILVFNILYSNRWKLEQCSCFLLRKSYKIVMWLQYKISFWHRKPQILWLSNCIIKY